LISEIRFQTIIFFTITIEGWIVRNNTIQGTFENVLIES